MTSALSSINEAYAHGSQAPLDLAIVVSWEAIMAALLTVDADLLRLVHLGNRSTRLAGAGPLRPGDVCSASARVRSVKISETGKTVVVKAIIVRHAEGAEGSSSTAAQDYDAEAGTPIIEVESSFFFRGRFKDFSNCFDERDDTYVVEVKTLQDASVLMAKEWFNWSAASPLKPGAKLELRLHSDLRHATDSSSYSAVNVTGAAYMRDHNGGLYEVGQVAYEADGKSYGNPVTEYVKRLGGSTLGPIPLEGGGYALVTSPEASTFVAPASNMPYSTASRDFNPIHVNPYFSDLAGLPGTITHGMHSSAAVRRIVEEVAAEGRPERFRSFDAQFTGMVLPGDTIEVQMRHVAMRDGKKIISVNALNQHGEKVLTGEATVDQAPTVYTFTGQGSQSQNMGMDLYETSDVAREIWERAERHLQTTMGISVLDIVRNNPKSHTCHFGGVAGARIRSQFMAMSFEGPNGEPRPLFPEITSTSTSYTFNSPDGLLFMTSFAQISIVLVEVCAYSDMKARGLIDPEAPFAGHSLGEYASLAAGGCLSIEDLCDVCLRRGLTMERAVARDADGRTDYGLMAVAPARCGLTDEMFEHIVAEIDAIDGAFLQAINYNVTSLQLVCAGNLRGLQVLTHTLNAVADAAGLTKKKR